MSIYINDIVEENTINCNVCKKTFKTDEITTDDFNFAWDNYVHTDCCNECSHKVLIENKNNNWRYIVWVGGVDDYYTTYAKAKEHYDEWIAKGYTDVIIEKIGEKNAN